MSDDKGDDDCVIPPTVTDETLRKYSLNQPTSDPEAIRSYMASQASDETVTYLEMIKAEHVLGRRYEVWDVRSDKGRWWVLTSPTNLYSQALFPSLDYTLSFHIGLMTRVLARSGPPASPEELDTFAAAWRRWQHAQDALDHAEEPEDFQAVGMRCRECLLEFVRAAAEDEMVPEGAESPKRGDFVHWMELVANTVAGGASAERVRGYLKAASKSTWELASWLTHAGGATRHDAQLTLDATQSVLSAFGIAQVRYAAGVPDRCPACGSYRVARDYHPERADAYVSVCGRCDWVSEPLE